MNDPWPVVVPGELTQLIVDLVRAGIDETCLDLTDKGIADTIKAICDAIEGGKETVFNRPKA